MTLSLTPNLSIRIRRSPVKSRRVARTETRHLSITSLAFMRMEVVVFKYHAK